MVTKRATKKKTTPPAKTKAQLKVEEEQVKAAAFKKKVGGPNHFTAQGWDSARHSAWLRISLQFGNPENIDRVSLFMALFAAAETFSEFVETLSKKVDPAWGQTKQDPKWAANREKWCRRIAKLYIKDWEIMEDPRGMANASATGEFKRQTKEEKVAAAKKNLAVLKKAAAAKGKEIAPKKPNVKKPNVKRGRSK